MRDGSVASLVGFDIRWLSGDFIQDNWTPAKRDRLLLKPSARLPLSVDTAVWPSRFRYSFSAAGTEMQIDGNHVKLARYAPFDVGAELWTDLNEMMSFWKPAPQGRDFGIAVAVLSSGAIAEKCRAVPNEVAPEWGLLGYDVADDSLQSSLFNFEVEKSEWQVTRGKWGPRVADNGLFSEATDAAAYRDHCNSRFPSHQPFHVYQLLVIWGDLESPFSGAGVSSI